MIVERFDLNHKGITELLHEPRVVADLVKRAEAVAAEARATAPVGTPPDDKHPGAYKASIETGLYEDAVSQRPTAYVKADVPYAVKVEIAHGTLGNALEAAGRL